MMRSSVRFFATSIALAALAFSAGIRARAQGNPAQPTPTQPTPAQTTSGQTTGNGTYVVVDPLAGVRYNNRYDVTLGLAYDHMKAGPTLLQGSNLGGLDASGSYWLT